MGANEILQKILFWTNQVVPEDAADLKEPLSAFKRPEKVLIIPSQFIGDNLLLTPFIRNLYRNLPPGGQIDIVASPAAAPLYETMPEIHEVFIEKEGPVKNPKTFLEAQHYDTIMLCRYSLAWSAAALRAQVPQRVGFDLQRLGIYGLRNWGKRLTHTIPSSTIWDSRPQAEIYLDMLRKLGLSVTDHQMFCHLTHYDRRKARILVHQQPSIDRPTETRILIHAASASPGKTWPIAHWERLLEMLQDQYAPVFLVTGSKKEASLYESWARKFPFINLCGQTSLRESIALMEQVDLVITLDTSIAHIAAIGGAPRLIVIYGPTNQNQWCPQVLPDTFLARIHQNLPCRPCMARTCEHKSCIREISPERVMHTVNQAFASAPATGVCLPSQPLA